MMHNPAHPGELLREELITELGLTVTAAAEHFMQVYHRNFFEFADPGGGKYVYHAEPSSEAVQDEIQKLL